LASLRRTDLLAMAERAHGLAQTQAVARLVQACNQQAGVA
jgi:hypothetical protein